MSILGNISLNLAFMYERCEGDHKLCYLVKIRKIIVEVMGLSITQNQLIVIEDGAGRDR